MRVGRGDIFCEYALVLRGRGLDNFLHLSGGTWVFFF